jgi:hypothetical protein
MKGTLERNGVNNIQSEGIPHLQVTKRRLKTFIVRDGLLRRPSYVLENKDTLSSSNSCQAAFVANRQ